MRDDHPHDCCEPHPSDKGLNTKEPIPHALECNPLGSLEQHPLRPAVAGAANQPQPELSPQSRQV
jgi:hypothetical protein